MNRTLLAALALLGAVAGCLPNEVDVAPDGRLVLSLRPEGRYKFVSSEDDQEIYVLSADLSKVERLTRNDTFDGYPRFARGGKAVLYVEQVKPAPRPGEPDPAVVGSRMLLFVHDLASGERRELGPVSGLAFPRVSPDGGKVAVCVTGGREGRRGPDAPGVADRTYTVAVIDIETGKVVRTLQSVLPITAWLGSSRLVAVRTIAPVVPDEDNLWFGRLTAFAIEPPALEDQDLASGVFFGFTLIAARPDGEAVAFAAPEVTLPASPQALAAAVNDASEGFGVHEVRLADRALRRVSARERAAFYLEYAPDGRLAHVAFARKGESRVVIGDAGGGFAAGDVGPLRFLGKDRLLYVETTESGDRPDRLLIRELGPGATVDVSARLEALLGGKK